MKKYLYKKMDGSLVLLDENHGYEGDVEKGMQMVRTFDQKQLKRLDESGHVYVSAGHNGPRYEMQDWVMSAQEEREERMSYVGFMSYMDMMHLQYKDVRVDYWNEVTA